MLRVRIALPISCLFLVCLLMPVETPAQPAPALKERRAAEESKPLSGPPPKTLGSQPLRRKAGAEGTGVGPLPGIPSGVTAISEVTCTYRAWVAGLPTGELGGTGEMEYRMEVTITNGSHDLIRVDIVCGMFVDIDGVQEILDCEKPKDFAVGSLRVESFRSDCGRRDGVASTDILQHNAYLRSTFDPLEVTQCRYEP